MLTMGTWIFLAVILVAVGLMMLLSRTPLFPATRKYHHDTFDHIKKHNIIARAKNGIRLFNGAMRADLFGDKGIQEQFKRALANRVPIRVLFGPYYDVRANAFMRLLSDQPARVQVRVIPWERRSEIYDESIDEWKFRHFAVADGEHVCIEERHGLLRQLPTRKGWTEYQNLPELARWFERQFDDLFVQFGVAVPLDNFVTEAQKVGVRFVVFEESNLREATEVEVRALSSNLSGPAKAA